MSKEFNGNLKEIILAMIEADTDCCEVTNTVGEVSVTVEVTITKITNGAEVVYDAFSETDQDAEVIAFEQEDIEYLS